MMRESTPQRETEQPQALVQRHGPEFDMSGSLVNEDSLGTGDNDGQSVVCYQKVASSNLVARCS